MSEVARLVGRKLWFWMLWFMRRPWIKRLQRRTLGWFGQRAHDSYLKQNRWARRHGLPMIVVAMNLLFGRLLITTSYLVAMRLFESGALSPPQEVLKRHP